MTNIKTGQNVKRPEKQVMLINRNQNTGFISNILIKILVCIDKRWYVSLVFQTVAEQTYVHFI
jgi:transposase